MRTLLAVASVALLVGAGVGCGDDTTTTSVADMSAIPDMTIPHDMQTLTCAQILSCEQSCGSSATCAGACVAEGTTAAKGLIGLFIQCLYNACNPDAGNANGSCSAPGDTQPGCLACIQATGQGAALGGTCNTEFMNCASM